MKEKEPRGTQHPKCNSCGEKLWYRRITRTWICSNPNCERSPFNIGRKITVPSIREEIERKIEKLLR